MTRLDRTLLHGSSALRGILLGILVVAIAARLAAALLVAGEEFRFVDEAIYFDAAGHLRSGAGYPQDYTNVPGYPAFLAVLGLVEPSSVLALRMAQATLVALGCLLCFELGRRLGGQVAGVAAAALYSLDPLLVVSATLLYPEALAGLLLAGALVAAWEIHRREALTPALIAGILLGAFTLHRLVGLALVPVMAGWVAAAPRRGWRPRATCLAVFLAAWAVVLSPWIHRNYQLYGRALPTRVAALEGVPIIGPEMARQGIPGAVATAIQRDPPSFASRTLREFAHFWELYPTRLVSDDSTRRAGFSRRDPRLGAEPVVQRSARDLVSAVSFGLELALAAIGLLVGWRTRRRETLWLVGVVLSFAVGYAIFHGKLRYRIPILPIVLTFAGVGLSALLGRLGLVGDRWAGAGTEQGTRPGRSVRV